MFKYLRSDNALLRVCSCPRISASTDSIGLNHGGSSAIDWYSTGYKSRWQVHEVNSKNDVLIITTLKLLIGGFFFYDKPIKNLQMLVSTSLFLGSNRAPAPGASSPWGPGALGPWGMARQCAQLTAMQSLYDWAQCHGWSRLAPYTKMVGLWGKIHENPIYRWMITRGIPGIPYLANAYRTYGKPPFLIGK